MSHPAFPVKPAVAAHPETHFSWLRTRLSVERTLMSWVRTSTAMIGFGFTIFQFFSKTTDIPGLARPVLPDAPRTISLSLVAIGTVALIAAVREYKQAIRYLWSEEFKDFAGIQKAPQTTPVMAIAVLIVLVGIFTLTSLVTRILR